MKRFSDRTIYIIIPQADITEAIINSMKRDFNTDTQNLRKSIDGSKVLIKSKFPVSPDLNIYKWYNYGEILRILSETQWEQR